MAVWESVAVYAVSGRARSGSSSVSSALAWLTSLPVLERLGLVGVLKKLAGQFY